MGNCIAGATTPIDKLSPVLQYIACSPVNKTQKRLSLCSINDKKKESSCSMKCQTGGCLGGESEGKRDHEARPRNERPLSSATFIVPYRYTLQYHNRQSDRSTRRTRSVVSFDDIRISSRHSLCVCAQDTLPRVSHSQKSLLSDLNDILNSSFDPRHRETISTTPTRREKQEPVIPEHAIQETTSELLTRRYSKTSLKDMAAGDIESADLLLFELKQLDLMNKDSKKAKLIAAFNARPKTRRGLGIATGTPINDNSITHDKDGVDVEFVQQKTVSRKEIKAHDLRPLVAAGDVDQSVTKCLRLNNAAVVSSSHKTIKGIRLVSSGTNCNELKYDETELNIIDEIEKEFTTS